MAGLTIDEMRREIALQRGALAPVIYCNGMASPGMGAGVGNVTLTATVNVGVDGGIVSVNAAVAHLRFPLAFIPMLRQALDEIELLAKPPASGEKN